MLLKRKKEKKEKYKVTTVSIWKPFYFALQAIKEKYKTKKRNKKSMSEVVRYCLNSEKNLIDVLEQEGIKMHEERLEGSLILTLNLSESMYWKMKSIKKINPLFPSSFVVNLCLMYRNFTVNSFLEDVKSRKAVLSGGIPERILKYIREMNKEKVSI